MDSTAAPALPSFPPSHISFDISTDQCNGSKTVRLLEASVKVPPYEFSEKVVSVWDSLEVAPALNLEISNIKSLWVCFIMVHYASEVDVVFTSRLQY